MTAPNEPKRLPLYAPMQVRKTAGAPIQFDNRLVNGYVEFDPLTKGYWIYKRPGLADTVLGNDTLFRGSAPRGIYTPPSLASSAGFLNNLTCQVSIWGNQLYVGGTQITQPVIGVSTVGPNCPFLFDSIPASETLTDTLYVAVGNAFQQLLVDPVGFNYTDITTTIPATVSMAPGLVYLDGTLYAMDILGNIYGSNEGDPFTWTALNVVAANSNSDAGMLLTKQLNYIVAMKQNSTQIFYDNGANQPPPGSPLAPVPDSQLPFGCYAPFSVAKIDEVLLWVSGNDSASPQVVRLDSLVPTVISTPSVERILQDLQITMGFNNFPASGGGIGCTGWALKLGGHKFYGLVCPNLNVTLVYDLDQKEWYLWTDAQGNYWPVVATTYLGAPQGGVGGAHIVQYGNITGANASSGLYVIDTADNLPNDFGMLFPVDLYTPNWDGEIDRGKHLSMMRFNADQTPGAVLNVRYNDNDYTQGEWSNFRNVDLGLQRPILPDCGSFYRRAWHLRMMKNTPMRLKSVDMQMGIGTL